MSYVWRAMFKRGLLLLALVLPGVMVTNAYAEKVVFEDVSFLYGKEGKSNPFTISHAGTYAATLVDFEFPAAFDKLDLFVSKGATEKVELTTNSFGSLVFDATPGLYFASVFGISDPGHTVNVSLYGLKISQLEVSAVPLPTALALFVSALLLFVGFGNAGSRLGNVESNMESRLLPA